jgi:hypothetical protein
MEKVAQKIYGHFELICPQTLEMQMNVLRPILLLDVAIEQMYILIENDEMKTRGKFKLAFRQMKLAESDIKLLLDSEERKTLATEMEQFEDFMKNQANIMELSFNNSMLQYFDTRERYLLSKLYVVDVVCQSIVLYFQHTGININKFVFFDFLKKVSHLCVKICEDVANKRGYDPNKSADIKTAVKIFINRLFKYGEERRCDCAQNEQK